MPVRKIKGSWWVDFSWKFERYRKRSPVNTRAGAQEYELLLRNEIAAHDSLDHLDPKNRPTEPTFAEFAKRWLIEYVDVENKPSERKSKRAKLRANILPSLGRLRLSEITMSRISELKRLLLSRGLSAKTVNNHLTILRRMLRAAVEDEVLVTLPNIRFLKTEPPKMSFLSVDEAERLIVGTEPSVWRVMVIFALRTGLRASELIALDWEDVDLERGVVCVRRGDVQGAVSSTKSNRIRYVPVPSDAMAILRTLPARQGRVFSFLGKPIAYNTALKHLQRSCVRAGIRKVGWHTLRHTYASHLVCRGALLKAVQDLLGHATMNMTLRYAHLTPEVLRETVSLLEPAPRESSATWRQPTHESSFDTA